MLFSVCFESAKIEGESEGNEQQEGSCFLAGMPLTMRAQFVEVKLFAWSEGNAPGFN